MARPKEFDRDQALHDAMRVFWTRGYEATTMTALRKAMGIGRQSLYDTFGDKRQIFAEALARYVSINRADVTSRLVAKDGLEGIRTFFAGRVDGLSSGERRGCLMINTLVELGLHDRDAVREVDSGLDDIKVGFVAALTQAQRDGDLNAEADVSELALYLTNQIAGMAVMAKNNASRDDLQAIANRALHALT